eukprot:TRINITY_DN14351_c1_g1_i1.p1 TRINITY_DN14351_c1_g1~~TRINITY_DN14351_c1_g1_i1.p1  ORF type:complete len:456 (-),score=68.29 TRINITY_DN14351_c1_g1_i1:19-1344(-)
MARPVPWGELCSKSPALLPTIFLVDSPHVIGRGAECSTTINNPSISSRHLRLEKVEGGARVVDSSTNGTFLNRARLEKEKPADIKPGDELSLVIVVNETAKSQETVTFVFNLPEPPQEKPAEVVGNYELTKVLGTGTFSEVRHGRNKETDEKVAVKVIAKRRLLPFGRNQLTEEKLFREVNILRQIQHPNITGIRDIIDTDDYLYLVLDLATGGELYHKIKSESYLTELQARIVFRQLCDAVAHLHGRGIAHRDLKPENILLARPNDLGSIKLSDFGLAQVADSFSMKTMCGSPMYVAPEVLDRTGLAQGYTKAVDLWSMGVILHVMLCGRPPFPKKGGKVAGCVDYSVVPPMQVHPWPEVSDEAKSLVRGLLVVDPSKRLDIAQVLRHPWLAQSDEDDSPSTPAAALSTADLAVSGRSRGLREPSSVADAIASSKRRRAE